MSKDNDKKSLPEGNWYPIVWNIGKVDSEKYYDYVQLALYILHRLSWEWGYIHPRELAEEIAGDYITEKDIRTVLKCLEERWLVWKVKRGRRAGSYALMDSAVEPTLAEVFGFIVWEDLELKEGDTCSECGMRYVPSSKEAGV